MVKFYRATRAGAGTEENPWLYTLQSDEIFVLLTTDNITHFAVELLSGFNIVSVHLKSLNQIKNLTNEGIQLTPTSTLSQGNLHFYTINNNDLIDNYIIVKIRVGSTTPILSHPVFLASNIGTVASGALTQWQEHNYYNTSIDKDDGVRISSPGFGKPISEITNIPSPLWLWFLNNRIVQISENSDMGNMGISELSIDITTSSYTHNLEVIVINNNVTNAWSIKSHGINQIKKALVENPHLKDIPVKDVTQKNLIEIDNAVGYYINYFPEYQWFKNGILIKDANQMSFQVDTLEEDADYHLEVNFEFAEKVISNTIYIGTLFNYEYYTKKSELLDNKLLADTYFFYFLETPPTPPLIPKINNKDGNQIDMPLSMWENTWTGWKVNMSPNYDRYQQGGDYINNYDSPILCYKVTGSRRQVLRFKNELEESFKQGIPFKSRFYRDQNLRKDILEIEKSLSWPTGASEPVAPAINVDKFLYKDSRIFIIINDKKYFSAKVINKPEFDDWHNSLI